MSDDKKHRNKNIENRLDAIIRLITARISSDEKYEMMKIYSMLNESGLSSGEIAKIFGRKSKDISSLLNRSKKKGNRT